MIIVQISDTHIDAANPAADSRRDDLARTVASINALAPRPDFVLHTGDVAHSATAADYTAARAELARLAMPVYATVGNRDRRRPFIEAFSADGYLGLEDTFAQYAVDLGSIRLVAVDTHDEETALGAFCPTRNAALARLLDAAPDQPTLVFAHHPPAELPDMASPALQYRDTSDADALSRCLAGRANVIGVVAGHIHRARAVVLGGVTLSTVPSIAADLSREKVDGTYIKRPVYHRHVINGSGMRSDAILV